DHTIVGSSVTVRLDRRVVGLGGPRIDIKVVSMRHLSSRWSAALYGRFLAWEHKVYPAPAAIKFGAHPRGRAFDLDVPLAHLPDIFGYDGEMRRFEILNRFVTTEQRCPLKRELFRAGV